jgi:hypothetical protein
MFIGVFIDRKRLVGGNGGSYYTLATPRMCCAVSYRFV